MLRYSNLQTGTTLIKQMYDWYSPSEYNVTVIVEPRYFKVPLGAEITSLIKDSSHPCIILGRIRNKT